MEKNAMTVDIFNLSAVKMVSATETSSLLNIYHPKLKDAGGDGIYRATLRFLPNISNIQESIIQRITYYLKDTHGDLKVVASIPVDQERNNILYETYWRLKKGNPMEQEMSKCINKKTSYMSLVQIIKDPQHPELEGTIKVFEFGKKVYKMINDELAPETEDIPACNVFGPLDGKNFAVIVKKQDGFPNYDSCRFLPQSPMSIDGVSLSNTEESRNLIYKYLEGSGEMLNNCKAKPWDDDLTKRVDEMIAIYCGENNGEVNTIEHTGSVNIENVSTQKYENGSVVVNDDLFSDINI